jgi:hypothetical protein
MTRNAKRRTGGPVAVAMMTAVLLALPGCGGSGDGADPAEPVVIPAKIASNLAQRSDEVATLVDTGNTCDAAQKADELADEVKRASDEIPAELRSELEAATQKLVDTVNCPPPPEEKPKKPKDEKEHGHGEGGYGDAPLVGESPGNSENAPGHNKEGGD